MSEGSNRVGARFWVSGPFPRKGRVLVDSSHGSAYLSAVPAPHRDFCVFSITPSPSTEFAASPYRGCTPQQPRRGIASTRPRATALLTAGCHRVAAAALTLDPGEGTYRGVPCWTGGAAKWAHFTVPIAYDLRYTAIRPMMCNGGVSRQALVAVAAARARYADHATGRNSRPTNERLARETGYTVRTIQRVDEALKLLGVATEVLRGRQRTRGERFASYRVGDRRRGWASVWALHDNRQLTAVIHSVSPHPLSGRFLSTKNRSSQLTTRRRRPGGRRQGGAQRRQGLDKAGLALAKAWRARPDSPPWSRRHSPGAWSRILAAPAQHGWTARDVNQMITDWLGVGNWAADRPHRPIGLLATIFAWHGPTNLDERPAALDEAREAQALQAQARARAAAVTEFDASQRAKAVGRQALSSSLGRVEVRRILDNAAQRRQSPHSTWGKAIARRNRESAQPRSGPPSTPPRDDPA